MNIDNYLAAHADALHLRAQRTRLLASNIANSDTPNYKARDMAFAEVLQGAGWRGSSIRHRKALSGGGLTTSNTRHIGSATSTQSAAVLYRQPEQASLDGNTVDKDQEQARFAENTVRYQASLQFINSRISNLIRTLRGE